MRVSVGLTETKSEVVVVVIDASLSVDWVETRSEVVVDASLSVD